MVISLVLIVGMNKNGENKKLLDAAGKYNMVQFGGAQAEWSEQAAKAEQYLLELQRSLSC